MNNVDLADQFKISWDTLEQFYDELSSHSGWEWVRPIKGLIRELRERGYDQNFRAGQALYLVMLSRSREHGLRSEQPRVIMEPCDDGRMIVEYQSQQGKETVTLNQMAFCPELQHILDRLLAQEID